MEPEKKRAGLLRGMLLATIPAVLFFPAVALLTVCPPRYGINLMRALAVAFGLSGMAAIWELSRIPQRKLDWRGVWALIGILIAAGVLACVIWGLMPPRVGPPTGSAPAGGRQHQQF